MLKILYVATRQLGSVQHRLKLTLYIWLDKWRNVPEMYKVNLTHEGN